MASRRVAVAFVLLAMGLAVGCSGTPAGVPATATAGLDPTATPLPSPTDTLLPTPSLTPTPTITPTATPTATWAVQGPGQVVCPILLYHHVAQADPSTSKTAQVYYVPPGDFAAQMKALHDWGYVSVSISQLAAAISQGAPLPEHPVVISFDDGNEDVFQNAFPIMQTYGFTGVAYIITNYMQSDQYMNAGQLKALAAAGWEIGSHSVTHTDLRNVHNRLSLEVGQSRVILQNAVGVSIRAFAYPYGLKDDFVVKQVRDNGYTSAVGLGGGWLQGQFNIYYLSRRPVLGGADLAAFASYLPWPGDAALTAQPTSLPTP